MLFIMFTDCSALDDPENGRVFVFPDCNSAVYIPATLATTSVGQHLWSETQEGEVVYQQPVVFIKSQLSKSCWV